MKHFWLHCENKVLFLFALSNIILIFAESNNHGDLFTTLDAAVKCSTKFDGLFLCPHF